MSDSEEEQKVLDLKDPVVMTKFRTAGDIANNALNFALTQIKDGASIVEVCTAVDAFITDATGKIFNKKKGMPKGIAFPTCLSANNTVGHYSPLPGEGTDLKDGDLVKIDLGVHIDGFAAVVAHTVPVGGAKLTGRASDVVNAVYLAANCVLRLLKVGEKNTRITEVIQKCAEEFNCQPVNGVLSHQMEQMVIDGEKVIMNRADPEQKVKEVEFDVNEAYAIDIVMSTGDGKPTESEARTTVYKRDPEMTFQLKLKNSRMVYGEIQKSASYFPFNIRTMNDAAVKGKGGVATKFSAAKVGIKEMAQHKMVQPYPILMEKEGEFTAQVKFTALFSGKNAVKITGLASPETDTFTIKDDELRALVSGSSGAQPASGAGKKKKKNKKKKKKKAKKESSDEESDEE
jgi:curved DNA binding protein